MVLRSTIYCTEIVHVYRTERAIPKHYTTSTCTVTLLVSIASLGDYLDEGVQLQTYAQQYWGQSISLVYVIFDGHLCN